MPRGNAPTDLFNQPLTLIPSVALIVVAAPLAEETFFRGFLFRGFLRRLGFAGAATVSGVVFALAHTSPSLIIPYTVIGVIFAYGYWRSDTLVSNTAAHLCFNLTSVVITLASLGRGWPRSAFCRRYRCGRFAAAAPERGNRYAAPVCRFTGAAW